MKPPTIDEVRARIIEKGWTTVNAQEFIDVNEGDEWKDRHGKPRKSWKGVLASWYHNSLRYGGKPLLCRRCKNYGCYPGTDDTGQQYWLCEDHKPQQKPVLPEELTTPVFKEAKAKVVDINDERNRQRKELGL